MTATRFLENIKPLVQLGSWAVSLLDKSPLNAWASYRASIPQSEGHDSTPTDLSILRDTQAFDAPDADYQIEHSPTVSQLLNASFSMFLRTDVPPEGLQPFVAEGDDGKQLEMVDLVSGVYTRVWKTDLDQIIIGYSGVTGGENLFVNPYQVIGQGLSSVGFPSEVVTPAKEDGVKFAQYVVNEAAKQGIRVDDVFVTGNSLGAAQAAYVAQQTGLGGIAFESVGLPRQDDSVGDGTNFITTNTYGDGIASFTTDMEADQPLVPAFDPERGAYPHYGQNVQFGDPNNQIELNKSVQEAVGPYDGIPLLGDIVEAVEFIRLSFAATNHKPEEIDGFMGVTLNPAHRDAEVITESSPFAFDVADYTIGQVLAADANRTDYHALTLPPV